MIGAGAPTRIMVNHLPILGVIRSLEGYSRIRADVLPHISFVTKSADMLREHRNFLSHSISDVRLHSATNRIVLILRDEAYTAKRYYLKERIVGREEIDEIVISTADLADYIRAACKIIQSKMSDETITQLLALPKPSLPKRLEKRRRDMPRVQSPPTEG